MRASPRNVKWKKPQLLVPFKGRKGMVVTRYSACMRVTRNVDLRYEQYEAVRRMLGKYVKGKRRIKNKKHSRYVRMAGLEVRQKKIKRVKLERIRMLAKCRDMHGVKKASERYVLNPKIFVPLTQKPLQMRMGKGKGFISSWVDRCRRNRVIAEFSALKMGLGKVKMLVDRTARKLPVKVKFACSYIGRRREFLRAPNAFFNRKDSSNIIK